MTQNEKQEELRRLLALDVREVSMVDEAANLRRFAVIKRLEEQMGEQLATDLSQVATDQSETGLGSDLASVAAYLEKAKCLEKMDSEVMKAMDPGLKAAIGRVMGFLGKITSGSEKMPVKKSVETPTEPEAETPAEPVAVEKAAVPEPETPAEPKAEPEPEPEPEPEAVAVEKAAVPEPETPAEPEAAPKAEAETPAEPEPVAVEKAKSFTAGRTKAMTEVFRGLAGVLKEVDEASFKAVLSEVGYSAKLLPAGAKVDNAVQAVPTTKAKELEILEDISTRLEAIEKTRAPATSVESDGATQEPVQKTKSFWAGIF